MNFQIQNSSAFKNLPLPEIYTILHTSEAGLSEQEVQERTTFFGTNESTTQKNNPILQFLKRYWGPMPWLLELAMLLSFLTYHVFEGAIIFALLSINAMIGFLNAHSAEKALLLLKKKLPIKAKVLRNGSWMLQEARLLVPGDICTIKAGDIVPTDAMIISGYVSIDESMLTGESVPKEKSTSEMVYGGSMIQKGEAKIIILTIGSNTYFGKIIELVQSAKPPSHQEKVMFEVIKNMMYVATLFSFAFAVYAIHTETALIIILTMILMFLMAAIPVALPAFLTMSQAITSMFLAKKGALVTRLNAIEDAASIDILCLDKTGTITQGTPTLSETFCCPNCTLNHLIETALLSSQTETMDAIDMAIIEYAKREQISLSDQKVISYTPFSTAKKRTEAIFEQNGKQYLTVKGASQIIVPLCQNDPSIQEVLENFAQKGFRTIAVAQSIDDTPTNMQLLGILAFQDLLREDSVTMIDTIKQLGIRPIMLTGDNILIAQKIAKEAHIGSNIIRKEDINSRTLALCDGVAEIYPEDKCTIIQLLQSEGHFIGMTGDGINDAPALQQAELGIAVDTATDVAKASASVVLTRPGLGMIVETITESRKTYQRMVTWVLNKITKVFQVTGLIAIGFCMTQEVILSLVGMALLLVANDFFTISLALDKVTSTASPNSWNVRNITLASIGIGALLILEGFIALLWGIHYLQLQVPELQSVMLLLLVFTSQCRVLILRERASCWNSMPGKTLLFSTITTTLLFILLGVYGICIPPLPVMQILALLAFSIVGTWLIDFPKRYIFKTWTTS